MARELERLTTLQVGRARPGWHHDGGGLYLRVKDDGAFWFFRYGSGGKKYLGLGPAHTVSLGDARRKAAECRRLLIDRRDPRIERDAVRAAAHAAAAKQITFAAAADAYCDSHRDGWRTAKHTREVRETLRTFAEPVFGGLAVGAIDTTLILKVLQPIWASRPDAATRLRQRMETVFDFATAHGWRDGANPARLKGHLDHLLPKSLRLQVLRHHPALPFAQVPDFMRRLRAIEATEARCIEFLILTAARLQEARFATFDEVDRDIWSIPASRMKKGRPHRIPLSGPAVTLVERQRRQTRGDLLFPGERGAAVSKSKLDRFMTKLAPGMSKHGLRASFSTWAAEATEFPDAWVETALAHKVGNDAARAYRRGDLLDQRRKLMDAWARYCAGESRVVPLRTAS